MLQPVEMTYGATKKLRLRYVEILVAADNAFGLMVVAAITGVFDVVARMAYLTSYFALTAMIQREGVGMKLCRRPCLGSVAILALETEKAGMDARFQMTLATFGWGAGKFLLHMTLRTIQFGVFAIQRKVIGVIESLHSVCAIVTFQANRAVFSLVLL